MEGMDYTVVDLEMTGLAVKKDRIIEIGAVRVRDGSCTASYSALVNPSCPIPERITRLTGITDAMASKGKPMDEAVAELLDFVGADFAVGHNIRYDYSFIKQWAVNHNRSVEWYACDTLKIARQLLSPEQSKTLEALCSYFGIERNHAHRALDDAQETQQVFERLFEMAKPEQKALFEPKHLQYHVKKQTPATAHQIEQLRSYREKHKLTDEIFWDGLTRNEASRIMDRYYRLYGR